MDLTKAKSLLAAAGLLTNPSAEAMNNYTGNGAMEYFTGNGAIEYYTGLGNPSLEFNGGDGANLLDVGDGAEPFVLQVTNAKNAARTFYLSQGILYTRGSESAGQLKTGTFAAINDTGTEESLTASTTNSVSIEQFVGYMQLNPTFVPLMQYTSSSATAQLSETIQYYRQGMIKNEVPVTVPFRKYAKGDQYNLQFQDIREPLYISSTTIIIVSVAASSTLTLNIYPLVSKTSQGELRGDVSRAKQLVSGDPAAAVKVSEAIKLVRGANASPLNSLNSRW